MKFLDIPSFGLSPGRLTVWRASAPPSFDAPWADDPRPASYGQEALITYALEAASEGPLPPSWLGGAFDLPAELDADAFAAAVRGWIDRHETLRSRLILSLPITTGSCLRRMTLPAGVVTIQPDAPTRRATLPTVRSWLVISKRCSTAKPAHLAGPGMSAPPSAARKRPPSASPPTTP